MPLNDEKVKIHKDLISTKAL